MQIRGHLVRGWQGLAVDLGRVPFRLIAAALLAEQHCHFPRRAPLRLEGG